MPELVTKIPLLGVYVDVMVDWSVGRCQGDYTPEVDEVKSKTLGDLTDLVLNNQVREPGIPALLTLDRVEDRGRQDPIRAALFGQPTSYDPADRRVRPWAQVDTASFTWRRRGPNVVQHEPAKVKVRWYGSILQLLWEQIYDSDAWPDAVADYERWLSEG